MLATIVSSYCGTGGKKNPIYLLLSQHRHSFILVKQLTKRTQQHPWWLSTSFRVASMALLSISAVDSTSTSFGRFITFAASPWHSVLGLGAGSDLSGSWGQAGMFFFNLKITEDLSQSKKYSKMSCSFVRLFIRSFVSQIDWLTKQFCIQRCVLFVHIVFFS